MHVDVCERKVPFWPLEAEWAKTTSVTSHTALVVVVVAPVDLVQLKHDRYS